MCGANVSLWVITKQSSSLHLLQALHLALTEPHHFLRELPEGLGVAPGQEDASLAYCLFDQVG